MAFPSRPHLLGLLLLLALPPEGTAALAMLRTSIEQGDAPPALEQRLQRIQAAVQERRPQADPAADADAEHVALNGPERQADSAEAAGADPAAGDRRLAFTFVNGPGIGWGNGGFRNGGFANGGWRNGGFYNGGFRNGGFHNGGFRNHW
jgi:rSAM-associated Gly-rich repeat protein